MYTEEADVSYMHEILHKTVQNTHSHPKCQITQDHFGKGAKTTSLTKVQELGGRCQFYGAWSL